MKTMTDVTAAPQMVHQTARGRPRNSPTPRPPRKRAASFSRLLATHPQNLACPHFWQCLPYLCHERTKVNEPVARRQHGEDPNLQAAEVLLKRNVPINSEKHIKLPRGDLKESPVFHAGPALLLGGPNLVIWEISLQSAWKALIEEDTHSRAAPPSPARERSPPAPGSRMGSQ